MFAVELLGSQNDSPRIETAEWSIFFFFFLDGETTRKQTVLDLISDYWFIRASYFWHWPYKPSPILQQIFVRETNTLPDDWPSALLKEIYP